MRPSTLLILMTVAAMLPVGCGGSGQGDDIESVRSADSFAGPIESLACSLERAFVQKGDFVRVNIEAFDGKGKRSRNVRVVVEPAQSARVIQNDKVAFDDDGQYQVTCLALDAVLSDSAAVSVGSLDPALSVDAAPYSTDGLTRLTGHAAAFDGAPVEVLINGEPVPVELNGRFETQDFARPGINTYTVVAKDAEGRVSQRLAWTLGGPFSEVGQSHRDALLVALPTSAYGQMSDIIESLLSDMIATPKFQESVLQSASGRNFGVKWEFHPGLLTHGALGVALRPHAEGIALQVVINDLRLLGLARTKGFFGWKSRDVRIDAERMLLTGLLRIRSPRDIRIDSVEVDLQNIDSEISDLPGWIEDILIGNLESSITDTIAKAIEDSGGASIQQPIEGFARQDIVALPAPLGGEIMIDTAISSLSANQGGIKIGLATAFDGDWDPLRATAPGPWIPPTGTSGLRGGDLYEAALSLGAVNGLFHTAWRSGALDLELTFDDALDGIEGLPEVKEIDVFVTPTLPPVVERTEVAGELFIQLGDTQIDAFLDTELGVINTSVAVSATAVVALGFEGDALTTSVRLVDMNMDLRVAPLGLEREGTRRFIEQIVEERALLQMAQVATRLPIPKADLSNLGLDGLSEIAASDLQFVSPVGAGLNITGQIKIQ